MSQRVFFPTPAGLFALRADLHYSRALSLRSKLHKATQDAWIHLGIDTGSRCLETFARAGGAVRTADEAITGTRPFAEPPCNERQLEGPSYQAACHVAVLLEALRLLRVASGLQGGPMSTRDWVITGAVQGRQIGPIGELKKKLAAITAAVHDAQLRPRPLLVVPTSQVDEARSALAAAQAADEEAGRPRVEVEVAGAGVLDDLLSLAIGGYERAATSWLRLAAKPTGRPEPAWHRLPDEPEPPLQTAFRGALDRYLLEPRRADVGEAGSGRDLFASAWARREAGEPLPGPPGAALDEALLRYAADAWAARLTAQTPEAQAAGPAEPEAPTPDGQLLRTWLGEPRRTAKWGRAQWDAFAEEAADGLRRGALPSSRVGSAARLVRLLRPPTPAAPTGNVVSLFGDGPTTRAPTDEFGPEAAGPVASPQPLPLRWDVASLVRHADLTTTELSSPLFDAWWEARGTHPGRAFVIGRGRGPTGREVRAAVAEAVLVVREIAEVHLFAGLTVIHAPEKDAPLEELEGLQLIAAAAAGDRATGAWGTLMQRPADPRAGLMKRLEASTRRTGLVRLHHQDPAWLEPDSDGGAAISLRPLTGAGRLGRAHSVSLPAAVLQTKAGDALVDAWSEPLLDRIVEQLDRRVSFYGEQLRDANTKIAEWARTENKDDHPDVWINQGIDLVALIAHPVKPEAKPARSFYEQDIPQLRDRSADLLRKAQTARRQVLAARRDGLRGLALQLFVDASMRGLTIDDVDPDASSELRRAWRAWDEQVGDIVRDAGHRWCRAVGLDSPAQRARVLTRRVVWRLYVHGDRVVLIPHALVHSRQSTPVRVGRVSAWVHPLDAAVEAPAPEPGPLPQRFEEAWAQDPGRAAQRLYRELWPATPPWDSLPGQAARARELEQPLAALREVMGVSRLQALASLLLDDGGSNGRGARGSLPADHPLHVQIPELAMELADALQTNCVEDTTHLEKPLERLAHRWDPEWVTSFHELGRRLAPHSQALQAAEARSFMVPEQIAALEAEYALDLVGLVDRVSRLLGAMDAGQSSLGELFVTLGDLGDALISDHGPDFGVRDAERLLRAAALVAQDR